MKAKKYDLLLVFLIVLIPRLICIALFSAPLRTPMDEMSTISTAAYFGGKDWTALTSFAKYYYGGGFTIFFAPLFYLTNNINIIYAIMLGTCAVLQSISAPISYYIMKKYFKVESRIYLFIGSIACSFMVVTRAMEVFNEHIVIGCVWIVALLLCKLIEHGENKKKKYFYYAYYVCHVLYADYTRQNKSAFDCFFDCGRVLSCFLQKIVSKSCSSCDCRRDFLLRGRKI